MTNLTTLDELKKRILTLAGVKAAYTPFVSCYLNLEQGIDQARQVFEQRVNLLRRIYSGDELTDFDESIDVIKRYLDNELLPDAKGLAFFARSSFDREFYIGLQFAVPLPDLLRVYPTPNIYHLVELKDTYESYVVLIATPSWVRIMEVNLGAASIQTWSENTPDSERVGWEWGETHYQLYRHHRDSNFLEEKINVLQSLMRKNEQSHLILAGDKESTDRVRQALPEALAAKLIRFLPGDYEITTQPDSVTPAIIRETLSAFVAQEELESRSIARQLSHAIRHHGLGVVGAQACLDALQQGLGETLVMLKSYAPDPGWSCSSCQSVGATTPESQICPDCGDEAVHPTFLREELVRLAEKHNCTVEMVEKNDDLAALGGVGCLLRHQVAIQDAINS